MIKIYTKTGDSGTTGLIDGSRVSKATIRIEVLGTFDEVNAAIGSLLVLVSASHETYRLLLKTQSLLFVCGSRLAEPGEESALGLTLPNAALLKEYEQSMDSMAKRLTPLTQFILPGGTELATRAHIARSLVRRAERLVVALKDSGAYVEPSIVQFMNRLSDWLFVLARFYNHEAKVLDIIWENA